MHAERALRQTLLPYPDRERELDDERDEPRRGSGPEK